MCLHTILLYRIFCGEGAHIWLNRGISNSDEGKSRKKTRAHNIKIERTLYNENNIGFHPRQHSEINDHMIEWIDCSNSHSERISFLFFVYFYLSNSLFVCFFFKILWIFLHWRMALLIPVTKNTIWMKAPLVLRATSCYHTICQWKKIRRLIN